MWDPKTLYERREPQVIKDSPRPVESRPTVTKLVPDNTPWRALNLRALGYASYEAYIRSALWKRVRAAVIMRANGFCEACHKEAATAVHHFNYDVDTLMGDRLDGLTATCEQCHKFWHTKPGKFRSSSKRKLNRKQRRKQQQKQNAQISRDVPMSNAHAARIAERFQL